MLHLAYLPHNMIIVCRDVARHATGNMSLLSGAQHILEMAAHTLHPPAAHIHHQHVWTA